MGVFSTELNKKLQHRLDHNQFISSNRNAAVEIRITMEAFGTEHKKQIIAALRDAGYEPNLIQAVLKFNF